MAAVPNKMMMGYGGLPFSVERGGKPTWWITFKMNCAEKKVRCCLHHKICFYSILPCPILLNLIIMATFASSITISKSLVLHNPSCSLKSSPDSNISFTMSSPPTSSPLAYSCGYVGQSLRIFSPPRTCSRPELASVREQIQSLRLPKR